MSYEYEYELGVQRRLITSVQELPILLLTSHSPASLLTLDFFYSTRPRLIAKRTNSARLLVELFLNKLLTYFSTVRGLRCS